MLDGAGAGEVGSRKLYCQHLPIDRMWGVREKCQELGAPGFLARAGDARW